MLVKCRECGGDVSTMAVSCPHCGCPTAETSATPTKRRRKHRRLPNGHGCVRKLWGSRTRPYAAYPPVTEWKDDGSPVARKAVGYFATYDEAYEALSEYRKAPYDTARAAQSFGEVYEAFMAWKFGEVRGTSSYNTYKSAYGHCAALYKREFASIRRPDLQAAVDGCERGKATKENIRLLFGQMYKFAIMEDICRKDYSKYVSVSGKENEKGEPFSEAALRAIWGVADEPDAQVVLMLAYSGLRISELCVVDIDLGAGTVSGGLKNAASRARVAPIHAATLPFWKDFDQASFVPAEFRTKRFYPLMDRLGYAWENGKKHTPHDCRHTFSWLCDRSGMDETCKHLLMGHALPGDTEQTVYRHRTMDELWSAVNMIEAPPRP